jgi:LysM repeat protein
MKRTIFITVTTILLLFSSAPVSAAAQSRCQDTYTVQYGDYLIKIAAEYEGISFLDIARANDLEAPYTLTFGQKLCIPKQAVSGSTGGTTTSVTSSNFSLRKQGSKLRLSVENLQRTEIYFVKVADAGKSSPEWFKVGLLTTDQNREGKGTFSLPDKLASATALTVCLKNVVTDDVICSDPGLTRYVEEDEDEEDNAEKATFSATRLAGGRIMISTSRFPKDSFWLVKVRVWGGDIQNWSEVGMLRTRNQSAADYIYDLPSRLVDEHNLYVCLKNQATSEAKCVGISG